MAETIVLDPSEVATGRTELSLTSGPIDVAVEGIDWGEAAISAYIAEAERGEIPVDYRLPNRQITIPLRLRTRGGTAFATVRTQLQKKVGLIQREGGFLKRVTSQGGTLFMDLTNATLNLPGSWAQANIDAEPSAQLELEAIPDFYEAETQLSDHTETSAAEIRFVETSIPGDYPARVRIVVDEDDAEDQLGLFWCVRSRFYDSAATAALAYEAEAQGIVSPAAATALTGATNGTVVTNGTISTSWTPIWNTSTGGTTYLTHEGTYRVRARVYSTSGTTVQTRFVWDVGDLVNPVENDEVRLPGASNFYIVDYGEVRLDAPPVGTHRWQGQIQARGDTGTESFSVDRIWFQNLDESAGWLSATPTLAQGLAGYSARSEFNTESGAISGDALAVGGNWGTAGDADSFSVAGGVATRSAVSDSGASRSSGHFALAGATNYTNIAVRVDFLGDQPEPEGEHGVFARYVDVNNWLLASMDFSSSVWTIEVRRMIASSDTRILGNVNAFDLPAQGYSTICLVVTASGRILVYAGPQGSALTLRLSGFDTNCATGGTLATGRVGFWDWNADADAETRTYDNFAAWVPPLDAVAYASQSVQLTTQGAFREDTGGTAYGPVSNVYGELPRLPVAGLESRSAEVMVKMSRGDLQEIPDSGIDDLSVRVNYSPSWLFAPD